MTTNDIILERGGELATMMWGFVVSLLEQRALRILEHQVYPHLLVGLLDPDPARRKGTLRTMEADWAAWQAAKSSPLPFWRWLCRQSLMSMPVVQQAFALARLSDFTEVGDGLREMVQAMFLQFSTSAICEHGFKFTTDRERINVTKRHCSVTLWRCPTVHSVMSGFDNWPEVDPNTVHEPSTANIELPATMFKPQYRNASMDFKDLPGPTKPEWSTWSSESVHGQYAEFFCMCALRSSDRLDFGSESWRCPWLSSGLLGLSRGAWHWVAASMHCALLLWLAAVAKLSSATVFGWASDASPVWSCATTSASGRRNL